MRRVYLETTIVSYLVAKPSRDLVKAARQEITWEWWERRRQDFEVYVSELVVREARAGDATVAKRRLDLLRPLPLLDLSDDAATLAQGIIEERIMPPSAADDALHVSLAAIHGMDFLMTWNCKHLANAALRGVLSTYLAAQGYDPPQVCTPDELMERTDAS